MGYISIVDRKTLVSIWSHAYDRSWSQTIAEDRTWFYLLRSSAIMIAGSQTIAEWCFHMIADDRRTFCDLRSAIVCDHMETRLKSGYGRGYDLAKIENRSRKLSHKLDGIGVRKIGTFPFSSDSAYDCVVYDPVKTTDRSGRTNQSQC